MKAWIISSCVLILAVLLLRALFKKRISPSLRYSLWFVVLIRLLLPFSIGESTFSVLSQTAALEQAVDFAPLMLGQETPFSPFIIETDWTKTTDTETQARHGAGLEKALFALWLGGAALVMCVMLLSNLRFASRLRRSRRDRGSFMGLPVYESPVPDSPCLFGLIKPGIYLSPDVQEKNCKHVLLHEHAHFRQGDHVWAWLRGICIALHWYNPLVWLAARLSKRDGELSCDERVTSALKEEERIGYGETLISLSCGGKSSLLCAVTPLSSRGRALKERIEYVVKRPAMLAGNMALVLLAVLIVTGCTFTGAKGEAALSSEIGNAPSVIVSMPEPWAKGTLLDRKGRELNEENFDYYKAAVDTFSDYLEDGAVKLTIDLELQKEAKRIIEDCISAPSGSSGCVVALDAKTGAPLAIVGMGEAVDPLTVSFKPYGLFYPCTAVTALSVGVAGPDTRVSCEGVFDRYIGDGISVECWINEQGLTHPAENVTTALRDSCGYYFCSLGNDSGIDAMEESANAMGLGVMSGIELPSSAGLMPGRETAKAYGMVWNIGHTLETAVGEGLCSFTPLQLAQYCSTLANNGVRYSASIVQELINSSGEVFYSRHPQAISSVSGLGEKEWEAVHAGLRLDGYAPSLPQNQDIAASMYEMLGDWVLSGKMASSDDGSVFEENLFMAYAPYDEPRIALAAVVISKDGLGMAQEIGMELIAAYKDMM